MLITPTTIEIRHEGDITTLRSVEKVADPGVGADAAAQNNPAPHPTGSIGTESIGTGAIGILAACGALGLASLAILLAIPFGAFKGSLGDQLGNVFAAVLGLAIAFGIGGIVGMPFLRGPVREMRIDRRTGSVDVVEIDPVKGGVRMKTATIASVRTNLVTLGEEQIVCIGTASLFGFMLTIKPEDLGKSGSALRRELDSALGLYGTRAGVSQGVPVTRASS